MPGTGVFLPRCYEEANKSRSGESGVSSRLQASRPEEGQSPRASACRSRISRRGRNTAFNTPTTSSYKVGDYKAPPPKADSFGPSDYALRAGKPVPSSAHSLPDELPGIEALLLSQGSRVSSSRGLPGEGSAADTDMVCSTWSLSPWKVPVTGGWSSRELLPQSSGSGAGAGVVGVMEQQSAPSNTPVRPNWLSLGPDSWNGGGGAAAASDSRCLSSPAVAAPLLITRQDSRGLPDQPSSFRAQEDIELCSAAAVAFSSSAGVVSSGSLFAPMPMGGSTGLALDRKSSQGPAAAAGDTTWAPAVRPAFSRVQSAPSFNRAAGHAQHAEAQQQLMLLPMVAVAASPPLAVVDEEELLALQQQLAAAEVAAAFSDDLSFDALLGLQSISHSTALDEPGCAAEHPTLSDRPGLDAHLQLQGSSGHSGPISIVRPAATAAQCASPGQSSMFDGYSFSHSCSPSLWGMSPAEHPGMPGLTSAVSCSSLSDAAALGSTAPGLSHADVSDMAAAVAHHKLQQLAALEVLQKRLQQQVVGLLPLI